MKPQELTMNSEAMVGSLTNIDAALNMTINEMMEQDLSEGTVTLKVKIVLKKAVAPDGEIIWQPKISSKTTAKYGRGFDLTEKAKPGLFAFRNREGKLLIGSNQISMDDLETA